MKVKNWDQFQHFNNRRPPWVKLYRTLLDDRDWHHLDGEDAKVLVMLWLLASEDEGMSGTLPDLETIAFRLRIPEDELKQRVNRLSPWLIHDDINVISERYQDDPLETEREKEISPKKKTTKKKANGWKQPFMPPTLEEVSAYIRERNSTVDPDKWMNFYESKGWMIGKNKMANWKACVNTWIATEKKKEQSESTENWRDYEP